MIFRGDLVSEEKQDQLDHRALKELGDSLDLVVIKVDVEGVGLQDLSVTTVCEAFLD